ncbi:MAG: ZIP family metal transporter [Minisyncoccia bacterium]
MEIWYALLAAFAVMTVSLLGVIFTVGRLGSWMQRYLTYLATFSGGVFLLIAYHLAEEAVHEGGWIVGVGSVLLGAALMEGIHFFFPLEHHHHGHVEEHTHSPIDGRRVLLSDALHNIGDGILLVGAFAADVWIGIAATVGVLLHEMVQEISEYFVLRESGLTNREALSRNFLVSSTILIGFVFAAFASGPFVAILAGLAAGGFLSVVLHDLLPHALASVRTHGGAYVHVLAALVGASAMFGLQSALPHEETEMHGESEVVNTALSQKPKDVETAPRPKEENAPAPPVIKDTEPTPTTAEPSATVDGGSQSALSGTSEEAAQATSTPSDQSVQTAGTRN